MGEGLAGAEQGSVEESDVAFVAGLLLSLDTTVSGSGLGNFEHRDRERLKVLAAVDRGPEPDNRERLIDALTAEIGNWTTEAEESAADWRSQAESWVAWLEGEQYELPRGPEHEGAEAAKENIGQLRESADRIRELNDEIHGAGSGVGSAPRDEENQRMEPFRPSQDMTIDKLGRTRLFGSSDDPPTSVPVDPPVKVEAGRWYGARVVEGRGVISGPFGSREEALLSGPGSR